MNKGLILVSVLTALFSNQTTADDISGGPRVNMDSGPSNFEIGDTGPAGGIVFYISNGDGNSGTHGLEAAPYDQGSAEWGCYFQTTPSGITGTAIGYGAKNTADILNAGCMSTPGQPEGPIAAKIAADYELNGYTDWFLPSKDELEALYLQKAVVGGFSYRNYWSSSEIAHPQRLFLVWLQNFTDGLQLTGEKKYAGFGVRPVRAF
ncbi:MAG: hypothetical protein ACQ9MH_15675 [Nitrospinales bacterium]